MHSKCSSLLIYKLNLFLFNCYEIYYKNTYSHSKSLSHEVNNGQQHRLMHIYQNLYFTLARCTSLIVQKYALILLSIAATSFL